MAQTPNCQFSSITNCFTSTTEALDCQNREEGLATYVSWRMNPSADENDVLLNKTLAGRARPLLPSLATDMLHNLPSKDPKEYAKCFLGNATDQDTPARSGYFLGFLVPRCTGNPSLIRSYCALSAP